MSGTNEVSKLMQIVEGWSNLIFPSKEVEQVAKARANICAGCPLNDANICNPAKGGCGCFIPALVRSMSSKCIKGKW